MALFLYQVRKVDEQIQAIQKRYLDGKPYDGLLNFEVGMLYQKLPPWSQLKATSKGLQIGGITGAIDEFERSPEFFAFALSAQPHRSNPLLSRLTAIYALPLPTVICEKDHILAHGLDTKLGPADLEDIRAIYEAVRTYGIQYNSIHPAVSEFFRGFIEEFVMGKLVAKGLPKEVLSRITITFKDNDAPPSRDTTPKADI